MSARCPICERRGCTPGCPNHGEDFTRPMPLCAVCGAYDGDHAVDCRNAPPEPMDDETLSLLDGMDDDDHIERERKEDALDDRYERDYGDR